LKKCLRTVHVRAAARTLRQLLLGQIVPPPTYGDPLSDTEKKRVKLFAQEDGNAFGRFLAFGPWLSRLLSHYRQPSAPLGLLTTGVASGSTQPPTAERWTSLIIRAAAAGSAPMDHGGSATLCKLLACCEDSSLAPFATSGDCRG
jgi:hypothetical protein